MPATYPWPDDVCCTSVTCWIETATRVNTTMWSQVRTPFALPGKHWRMDAQVQYDRSNLASFRAHLNSLCGPFHRTTIADKSYLGFQGSVAADVTISAVSFASARLTSPAPFVLMTGDRFQAGDGYFEVVTTAVAMDIMGTWTADVHVSPWVDSLVLGKIIEVNDPKITMSLEDDSQARLAVDGNHRGSTTIKLIQARDCVAA